MPLPTLIKTWEFRTNVFSRGWLSGNSSSRPHVFTLKNLITDTLTNWFATGTISAVAGTVWRLNPNPGSANGTLNPALVGSLSSKKVRMRGHTTTDNNGDFIIVGHSDLGGGEWVIDIDIPTGSPAAEPLVGSVNVLSGAFTNPWVLDHCTLSSGHIGVQGDGIDAIDHYNDLVWNISGGTSWVARNPVTGTYWSFGCHTNSSDFSPRAVVRAALYPNIMVAPGVNNGVPLGTSNFAGGYNHTTFNDSSNGWYNNSNVQYDLKFHMMMSSDGEQTRLFACHIGLNPLIWIDGKVDNPHPLWTNPAYFTAMQRANADGNRATYGAFNDAASIAVSGITEPNPPSPEGEAIRHNISVYATTEGYGAAANGQNWTGKNQLSNAFELYPWGLVCLTPGLRARLGEIPDIWFCPTQLTLGHTLPADNSRQFVCLEDIVLPWDGSFPEVA